MITVNDSYDAGDHSGVFNLQAKSLFNCFAPKLKGTCEIQSDNHSCVVYNLCRFLNWDPLFNTYVFYRNIYLNVIILNIDTRMKSSISWK